MAKVMLILEEKPSSCAKCPVVNELGSIYVCGKNGKVIESGYAVQRVEWCPLREVPQKKIEEHRILKPYEDTPWHKRFVTEKDNEAIGYNACIDEILGGGE